MISHTKQTAYKGVYVTDLDGTLLPHQGEISPRNLALLQRLGEEGVCRVLATGRSLYSLQKAIPQDTPFDYVIFATGAGILDWHNGDLLHARNLDGEEIRRVAGILEEYKVDYMLHAAIPDTHNLHYRNHCGVKDFHDRIGIYRASAKILDPETLHDWDSATQFLAIVDSRRKHLYDTLQQLLAPLSTIRTTSPLDFDSLWIEIFAPEVNKGSGLFRLLELIGMDISQTMVIGNDYNDINMLTICPISFVTANAPEDLKARFRTVPSCCEDGFAHAAELWLQDLSK